MNVEVNVNVNAPIQTKNTYRDSEFFKINFFSSNKEYSIQKGAWLTGSKDLWRGFFVCPFKKTKIVLSVNWLGANITQINTTISSECVVLFVNTAEEWEQMKPTTKKLYSKIPVKVIFSELEEAKTWAKEIKGSVFNCENPEDLKNYLDQQDKAEFNRLATYFSKYDSDKSGFIEVAELPGLASALDEDPNSDEFKNSMLVFDVNKDNKIALDEFIVFWKIGRQNTLTLAKVYEFQLFLKEAIYKKVNFENFRKEIKSIKAKKDDKQNKISVSIKTKENIRIKTRIESRLAIGGSKRLEAVKNFISKFTDNLDPINENWINISVFLKSETIDSKTARTHLEEFRENLLKFTDQNFVPGLSGFISNFLNVKSYNRECSATVLFRLKFDVESIMKDACETFVKIVESLSENNKGIDFNLKLYSQDLLEELFKNDETIGALLKNAEISIESTCVKSLLKTLFLNLSKDYQNFFGLAQLLFAPSDMKMDFQGPISELQDQASSNILNMKLAGFASLITFIKSNLNPILLKSMKRLEIGFHLFDLFFNMQIFSDTLWEHNI